MPVKPSSNNANANRGLGPVAALALRVYKMSLSPLLALFGARCRHAPTCSEYAALAVSRFGIWPGSWMALARVQRCHPFGSSGVDPVPEDMSDEARWYLPWRYGVWRLKRECSCGDAS